MAVRSRRLWGPTAVSGAATALLYTVPSGRTAVVRTVTFYKYGDATPTPAGLLLNGTGQNDCIFRADIIQSRSTFAATQNTVASASYGPMWDSIELNPGDQLYLWCTSNTLVCAGFGSLLLGEPE